MKMLKIGDVAKFSKTISEGDVYNFAGITGDFNPIHVNKQIAEKSKFHGQVCHGMLSASFISTVIGMQLPGPGAIYLEQHLKFIKPVYIGDTIEAVVEIIAINKNIFTLETKVINQKMEIVIDGTAVVMYRKERE